ncbi:MAG TPA: type 1 glutamine amidotransferase domain-containing protein, partial [Bacteroidia bacterium]|nr:type 1 glutamine amidotransferase domain-containing protein [Bacteroidia bacterium]
MEKKLIGKKVAIIATDGFEQSELEEPRRTLLNNGATVDIISLKKGKIKGWKNKSWGDEVEANVSIDGANSRNYDALVIPGGVMNPDKLRMNKDVVNLVKDFFEESKPIAAICHGPSVLIETDMIKGRKLTSYESIKTDLINAGAKWLDEEVVTDKGLVTSRTPKDL